MMENLIHIGMGLFLVSYAVRDILWLRIITVIAACVLIPAYVFRVEPVVPAVMWNGVFAAINLVWIVILLRERHPVKLTGDAAIIHELAFSSLSPREMNRLLALGHWKDLEKGDVLIEEGIELNRLLVTCRGSAEVLVRGEHVNDIGDGRILGDVTFLTGGVTSSKVVATAPTRLIWWDADLLRRFMDRYPNLRSAILTHVAVGAAAKLRDLADRGEA